MPKSGEHFLIGAVAGVLAGGLLASKEGRQMTLAETLEAGLVGGISGSLPDVLEPATNPRHRKFFHSISTLGGLGYYWNKVMQNPMLTPQQKYLISIFAAGYASHLAADSTTPSGVPLF